MTTLKEHKAELVEGFRTETEDLPLAVSGRVRVGRQWDALGNPTGGGAQGPGIDLEWQVGHVDSAHGQNGPVPVDLANLLIDRLEWYQSVNEGAWACVETAQAILKLKEARMWMGERQRERKRREVQGTYKP